MRHADLSALDLKFGTNLFTHCLHCRFSSSFFNHVVSTLPFVDREGHPFTFCSFAILLSCGGINEDVDDQDPGRIGLLNRFLSRSFCIDSLALY